jgi:hypothetical protein
MAKNKNVTVVFLQDYAGKEKGYKQAYSKDIAQSLILKGIAVEETTVAELPIQKPSKSKKK